MVTCRPDIAFPLIKLSQYSANPGEVHYKAVISLFQYLHATRTQGLTYWRSEPHPELDEQPPPKIHKGNFSTNNTIEVDTPDQLHGAVDSDWADDTSHRKSVTGIILRLAGGTIYCKTKYQDTIAHSTTEAEFTAACDAGKAILYIRSILEEINVPQEQATALYIDNQGALLMGNAQKPTRRTRHMDIKKFAILEWIQQDLLLLKRISTSDNYADGMTKQTGRQLFYRHFDYILGNIPPTYTNVKPIEIINKHKQDSDTTINALGICMICYSQEKENILFQEHGGIT